MARLIVVGDRLEVRLNWLEKLAVGSFRTPVAPGDAIQAIDVVDRPASYLRSHVDFGWGTAPWPLLFMSIRARFDSGRAAVLVYWRRRSVRVLTTPHAARWGLFLVSCINPEAVATKLREDLSAAGFTGH